MDWEELKMSIRKVKTARKGRRSKSRDVLREDNQPTSNNTSATAASTSRDNKEISIDITLDMQQGSNSSSADISTEKKRPPMLRRISGGWADGVLKTTKSKKGSVVEDERFQFTAPKTAASNSILDDIPIVPDIDDVKDGILLNEIMEPPTVPIKRIPTLSDLEPDLLAQNAFTQIEGIDLSILARGLLPQNTLDEPDEVWEWQKLFTDVVAELNSEKRGCVIESTPSITTQKYDLAPDELPPPMHL